ncbi:GNAT family acetyltransferase [Sphingomonas sp. NCPPB 2930]
MVEAEGAPAAVRLRAFAAADTSAVVALWQACGLVRPWNDPVKDIARKQAVQPEMFLVAEQAGTVVGSAMVGYDGHRGWVYYLAVAPGRQRLSIGRRLMDEAERMLLARGCPKVNLLVRAGNTGVLEFYRRLGYLQDASVSLGKRLIPD